MKWMFVAICANAWTGTEYWCTPLSVFETEVACMDARVQLNSTVNHNHYYCIPKPEDKK